MIKQYYRTKNGNPRGLIIALDKGIYGWSLCSKKDVFNKKVGTSIAMGRAQKAALLSDDERFDYYQYSVPNSMWELFTEINKRAYKYFK